MNNCRDKVGNESSWTPTRLKAASACSILNSWTSAMVARLDVLPIPYPSTSS